MPTYTYPPDEELAEIESDKLEALNAGDPLEEFMPTRDVDAFDLRWSVDGFAGGLQQLRGLDGDPGYVQRVGATDYVMEAGAYGEFMLVKEKEMTQRGQRFYPGMVGGRVDVADLVLDLQDQLLLRRIRLTRYIRAALLTSGTFAVADKKGAGGYRHTDTYAVQTHDASTWATIATATPILDFRNAGMLDVGLNADFGSEATALMNKTTFTNLIRNTNANDLGGQKTTSLSPLTSAEQFNTIMLQAGLPQIRIWNDGWYDASNGFHLFVPNGTVALLSRRMPEGPIGEYRMVYQAVTDAVGPYRFTKNSRTADAKAVPPKIEVHDGHNGGPVIYRPWQVVIMDVS